MNSENSKTSHPHGLLLSLTDKIDLRRGKKSVALFNLCIYYAWKKAHTAIINLKYQLQLKMINLSYQTDHILYKIKTGFYLDLLTSETMKLLGSTKNK